MTMWNMNAAEGMVAPVHHGLFMMTVNGGTILAAQEVNAAETITISATRAISIPTITEWQVGQKYLPNSIVFYNGHIYVCKQAHFSMEHNAPPIEGLENDYWSRVDRY